jgi:hypothetical protein
MLTVSICKSDDSYAHEQFYILLKKSMIARLSDTTEKQDTIVNWSVKSDRNTFGSMYCDFMNTDLS